MLRADKMRRGRCIVERRVISCPGINVRKKELGKISSGRLDSCVKSGYEGWK